MKRLTSLLILSCAPFASADIETLVPETASPNSTQTASQQPPARDPQVGDSTEALFSLLGAPQGTIEIGSKTRYLYNRGTVTVEADQVIAVELVSEAQAVAQEAQRLQAIEDWKVYQAQRDAERIARGEKLKDEKLQDVLFLSQPVGSQINFWKEFQAFYPEIEIAGTLQPLLEDFRALEEERRRLEQAERLAELERRVADAEANAADAQRRANEANRRARSSSYYRYYPTGPSVILHPRPRPPVSVVYRDKNWNVQFGNTRPCPTTQQRPVVVVTP